MDAARAPLRPLVTGLVQSSDVKPRVSFRIIDSVTRTRAARSPEGESRVPLSILEEACARALLSPRRRTAYEITRRTLGRLRDWLRAVERETFVGLLGATRIGESTIRRAQALLGAFTGSGFVLGADEASYCELVALCARAAVEPQALAETVITIAYGASVTPTSVRLPAYLIPAATILGRLRALRSPLPRVRLVTALCAGVSINALDAPRAFATALRNSAITIRFAQEHFPDVAHRLFVDVDLPLEGRLLRVVEELGDVLRREIGAHPNLRSALERIRQQAGRRGLPGDKEAAKRYGACHAGLFGDVIHPGAPATAWTRGLATARLPTLVSIGGPSERYFYFVRRHLAQAARGWRRPDLHTPTSIHLETEIGELPVYDCGSPGDVPLAAAGTLLRSDGTPAGDHRVERDLQAISSATGLDRRGLVAFSHRMRDLFEQAERRAPAGVEAAAALCLAAHAQGEPMLSAAGVLDAVGRVELAEVLARAGLHGLAEAARWTRAGTP